MTRCQVRYAIFIIVQIIEFIFIINIFNPLVLPGSEIKNPRGISAGVFLLPMMTSYFLWHLAQLAASFTLKALVPLWQAPQNFPASMSFMVMTSPPFFILKRPD